MLKTILLGSVDNSQLFNDKHLGRQIVLNILCDMSRHENKMFPSKLKLDLLGLDFGRIYRNF